MRDASVGALFARLLALFRIDLDPIPNQAKALSPYVHKALYVPESAPDKGLTALPGGGGGFDVASHGV